MAANFESTLAVSECTIQLRDAHLRFAANQDAPLDAPGLVRTLVAGLVDVACGTTTSDIYLFFFRVVSWVGDIRWDLVGRPSVKMMLFGRRSGWAC